MNAEVLIKTARNLCGADAGVEALADRDRCIMDECYDRPQYKCEGGCLDYLKCSDPDYILACLATRQPEQLASWVVDTYIKGISG